MFESLAICRAIHQDPNGCDQWLVYFNDRSCAVVNSQGRVVATWAGFAVHPVRKAA